MKKVFLSLLIFSISGYSLFSQTADSITYKTSPVLSWKNFKQIDTNNASPTAANFDLTIATYTEKVNVWTGIITVSCYAGSNTNLNWVKPDQMSEALLAYFQVQYDIANHIAKHCAVEINRKKINAGNRRRIGGIIEDHLRLLDLNLARFETENPNGSDLQISLDWLSNIANYVTVQ